MSARWLVDENVPKNVVDHLRGLGHDVLDVADSPYRGLPDPSLWQIAARQGRLVLTRDLGFVISRRDLPLPGVLLIRAPDEWRAGPISRLVEAALREIEISSLNGNITVVEPGRIRQRPLSGVDTA